MLRKVIIRSFKLLACFLTSVFFFSALLMASEKPPLLIYNQFPRIWGMDFQEMEKYLKHIKWLGFNAVWVNPFMKTSKYNVVLRTNKETREPVKSIRSLYGMFDPSLTEMELYTEESNGDPSSGGKKEKEIEAYLRKLSLYN